MRTYLPSRLLDGEAGILRQQSLTRWMSRDLTQAAVDFCRHLGLIPIYGEFSSEQCIRYLFWSQPQGAILEVRSGRTKAEFEKFDEGGRASNRRLLSLHLNEAHRYSAVWISEDHFENARLFLAAHGIITAESHEA